MTFFINPAGNGQHSLLRVTVRFPSGKTVTVDAIAVFGCLALHNSVADNDLQITHIQSGIVMANVSRNTPIESCLYQLHELSSLMELTFDPKELDEQDSTKAKLIVKAIVSIDAVYR